MNTHAVLLIAVSALVTALICQCLECTFHKCYF